MAGSQGMAVRVVIIGGGFAGVSCAQRLLRRLRRGEAEIVLFNRENHMVFSPLLADCVGSSLNSVDVMVPLRQMLPGVTHRTEAVDAVDPIAKVVQFAAYGGGFESLSYDHLIITSGNQANLNAVPGMVDHAFPLKTVGDAEALRSHVLRQLEVAEVTADPARRRHHLSFVVVGGGYSGVESAGEINDLVRSSLRFFPHIPPQDVAVRLVHSREQILPEISSSLRDFARERMEKAGVEILLRSRAARVTGEGVRLEDGRVLDAATVVCTVGTEAAPFVARLDVAKERGRLRTDDAMRVSGYADLWACGDCALVKNAHDGEPSPPTGQFAMRQGRQLADNLVAVLRGQPTRPFGFKPLGQLCSIGGHEAVAEVFGLKLSGFLAWFVWRSVYLMKLPTWSSRFKVGLDWAWLLLFPRDLAHQVEPTTERVAHAHYEPGDVVFREGAPPDGFYVIDKGEVDVVKEAEDGVPAHTVAVLGAGSFFGEQALLDNAPRNKTVRARTEVDLVIMGASVFQRVSSALAPFREALVEASRRRREKPWLRTVDGHERLERVPVERLMSPSPPVIAADQSLLAVARLFERGDDEVVFVADPAQGGRLIGVITVTDLVGAHSAGAAPEMPAEAFMTRDPVTLGPSDSALTALSALRERGIRSIPVVDDLGRPVGLVRGKRLMGLLVADQARPDASATGAAGTTSP